MINIKLSLFVFCLSPLLLLACASTSKLTAKPEYQLSREYLSEAKYKFALESLPEKKDQGFILSAEKTWLGLLAERPQKVKYKALSDQLEKKKYISITEDLSNYFIEQEENQYFPAEYEVVWFHLLNAMTAAKLGDKEASCVENRKAGQILQGNYDDRIRSFDSPELRELSAVLRLYCSDFENAKVDLKIANKLRNQNGDKSIESGTQPTIDQAKQAVVILKGTGPEPFLNDYDNLDFVAKEDLESVFLVKGDKKLEVPIHTSSNLEWYDIHQNREIKFRQNLRDSSEAVTKATVNTSAGIQKTTGYLTEGIFYAAGIIAGTAMGVGGVYILSQGTGVSGEAFGLVLGLAYLVGSAMVEAGSLIRERMTKSADKYTSEHLDQARTYRFVRFIPEKMRVIFLNEGEHYELQSLLGEKYDPFLKLQSESGPIHFYHLP